VLRVDRAAVGKYRASIQVAPNGCHLWTKGNLADGYARWTWRPGEKPMYVHVWVYLTFIGDIPDGMQVGHVCHDEAMLAGTCQGGICDHRRCSNKEHLALQTASENTTLQDHANRRKDTCPKGGPLSGDNLVIWNDGKRRCRMCIRKEH
jgi:hypothetical protein